MRNTRPYRDALYFAPVFLAAVVLGLDFNTWAGPLVSVPSVSSDMVTAEPLSPTLVIPRAYGSDGSVPGLAPRASAADDPGSEVSAPIPYDSSPDTSGEAPIAVFGTADDPPPSAANPDDNAGPKGPRDASAKAPGDAASKGSLSGGAPTLPDSAYATGSPDAAAAGDDANLYDSASPLG
ncbi:MAG: hypothetical protein ACREP6_11585, partial [Candidatus Binataceae bacterium]